MHKSQLASTALLVLLLLDFPIIPSSLRSSYIFFLFYYLIVALAIEGRLLNVINLHDSSRPDTHELGHINASRSAAAAETRRSWQRRGRRLMGLGEVIVKERKSRSKQSLFFIDGEEDEDDRIKVEEDEDEGEEFRLDGQQYPMSAKELFAKAEKFIGNFYLQLKMQREESWKTIHGLYHKAF